jgi:hypothetical protein
MFFMRTGFFRMAPLRPSDVPNVTRFDPLEGENRVRSHLLSRGSRRAPGLRRLRRAAEARLTMLMILLYAAGGMGIAIYMVAALLRPDKF